MGVHGRSGVAGLTLVSLLVLAGPGSGAGIQAQDTTLFTIPSAAELPAAATTPVDDTPAQLPASVDLTEAIETAFAQLDSLPSEAWEVAGLAPTLSDPVGAFELVRDSIRFDPYPGMLRGAEGTLTARGGNAFDRAVLLKALLDGQGATTRLAFGRLDTDVAEALVDHALDAPLKPLPSADFSPFGSAFDAATNTRARRDYALLSEALGDRLTGLQADGTPGAIADVMSHAWVQLQQADGTWLDLDPSLPDTQPGETLTTAATTSDVLPDDARQTVTLRVVAETLQDGELSKSVVLAATLDPSIASDQQILVTFTPDTGTSGGGLLGNSPGGVFGGGGGQGEGGYLPMLMINGGAWSGEPVRLFTAGGGGGLMGGGSPQQDLAGLALEIQTDAPGLPSQVARHIIVDRAPAASRAAGTMSPDDLMPVSIIDESPAIFSAIVHVMLSTGGSSPRSYAWQQGLATQATAVEANQPSTADTSLATAFAPLAVADATLVVASEQRLIPALDDQEVRAIIARPRVYLAEWAQDPTDPTQVRARTDLLIDTVRTLPRAAAASDAAARHQLWYGALEAAVETEHGLRNGVAFEPGSSMLTGVSFDMDEPLTVLSGDGIADLPSTTDPALATMLATGDLVIVPGDPGLASTWWQVAQDGTTRSILAPTLGGLGGVGRPPSPGGTAITPIKPLDKQPGQQRRPDPKPTDEWEEDDDEAGNEYGTLVNEVGTKTEQVAQPGSEELRLLIEAARKGIIRG